MQLKSRFFMLCFCAFMTAAHAEEAEVNTQDSNKQRPPHSAPNRDHHRGKPAPDRPAPPAHGERRDHHARPEPRSGISISLNLGGLDPEPSYPEMNRHDRPFSPPHHRRPRGIDWVGTAPGGIPPDAVSGGFEHHRPLYVCRANYRGGVHPGKLVNGRCHISWGGYEVVLNQYQILGSPKPLSWAPAGYGDIPPNAIPGGHEDGATLYICQARYNGGIHIGKVIRQTCNFGWGGTEVTIPQYNVLVG